MQSVQSLHPLADLPGCDVPLCSTAEAALLPVQLVVPVRRAHSHGRHGVRAATGEWREGHLGHHGPAGNDGLPDGHHAERAYHVPRNPSAR